MTALVSFERVFEVLDLEPLITERRTPSTVPPRTGRRRARRRALRLSLGRPVRSPRSRRSRCSTRRSGVGAPRRLVPRRARASVVALVGTSGGGKSTIASLSRACTTSTPAPCASAASTSATSRSPRSARRSASSPRTVTCSTTRSRENLRFARPEADRRRAVGCAPQGPPRRARRVAARRPRHDRRRAGLPLLRRRAPAAHDRPPAARPTARGDPRRGDVEPRLHVRGRRAGGAERRPRGPHRRR